MEIAVILEELGYWLLFSLVIGLAQLWLIPLAYYLGQKPWTWIDLIGNGSLLFFATTITSRTAGEYFRKVKQASKVATLLCIVTMFAIIIVSVFSYGIIVATRMEAPVIALSPARVAITSALVAIFGLLFSLSYTIYIRIVVK